MVLNRSGGVCRLKTVMLCSFAGVRREEEKVDLCLCLSVVVIDGGVVEGEMRRREKESMGRGNKINVFGC